MWPVASRQTSDAVRPRFAAVHVYVQLGNVTENVYENAAGGVNAAGAADAGAAEIASARTPAAVARSRFILFPLSPWLSTRSGRDFHGGA